MKSPKHDSVWITGVGAVTPLGNDFEEISRNFLAGKSAIRKVTSFDVAEHPCQIAGQIETIPCPLEIEAEDFAKRLPVEQASLWCCAEALRDADLWQSRGRLRIGVVMGLGAEMMQNWTADYHRSGTRCLNPKLDDESTLERTCRSLELRGPHLSVAAACASGNHALAFAKRWLEMGWVDVCLAGACDMGISTYSLAGFGNLRALSRRNQEPTQALRPFDLDRDGMVLGEGGAMFVLESAQSARRRGRSPYAELAGVGATSDSYHMVIPSPEPDQGIAAMRLALQDAHVNPDQIDYVNAHATGTPVGDPGETRILQAVLGSSVNSTPVSATKSMTGHLLGAAAAVEALACLTAIRHNAIPPTINLDRPDPKCQLHHVANHTREHIVNIAISNSFGFGGHNTSLVLRSVCA